MPSFFAILGHSHTAHVSDHSHTAHVSDADKGRNVTFDVSAQLQTLLADASARGIIREQLFSCAETSKVTLRPLSASLT